MLVLTGCQTTSLPPIDADTLHIPAVFYADRPGACPMHNRYGGALTLADPSRAAQIRRLVGYDWQADHAANSTSLSVDHQRISRPMMALSAIAHNGVAAGDRAEIGRAVELMAAIAGAESLLDTMTFAEVRALKTRCYGGNQQTGAVCHFHAPQYTAIFGANFLIAALWLRPHMAPAQRRAIGAYIEKMHDRFLAPYADQRNDYGLYEMANGGIGRLAYAAWTGDKALAASAFHRRFAEIDDKFFDDGYINNNSFRGVRGLWYHTWGVNQALAVLALAEAWQVRVPPAVRAKVRRATELINLGVADLKAFNARPFFGSRYNASTDPKDARPHIHQMAMAIDTLAHRVANVTLARDPTYVRKRQRYWTDWSLGFNPECLN